MEAWAIQKGEYVYVSTEELMHIMTHAYHTKMQRNEYKLDILLQNETSVTYRHQSSQLRIVSAVTSTVLKSHRSYLTFHTLYRL